MIYQLFDPKFFPEIWWIKWLSYLTCVIFIMLRAHADCKILGERFYYYPLLIIFFPLIFTLCWFFIWPRTAKITFSKQSLRDTLQAKLYRRSQRNRTPS